MENTSPICPACKQIDVVKKVSAIVEGETYKISGTERVNFTYEDKSGKVDYGTNHVPFSGTQVSVLAQHLSPPPEPTKKARAV